MNAPAIIARRLSLAITQVGRCMQRGRKFLGRIALSFVVFTLCACTETVDLQTGLKDGEANEIVSILSRNGIDTKKYATKDGVTLTVKDADLSRATDVMQAAGLPRRNLSNLGQVFKKTDLFRHCWRRPKIDPRGCRSKFDPGLSAKLNLFQSR